MKNSQLIKENKTASGYTKVYPLAYIQGIFDADSGEKLEDILKSFNHIYLPFQESIRDTRISLPISYRRKGIFITYRVEEELVTEFYIGNDKDLDNDAIFSADANWEIVPNLDYIHNSSSKIPDGTILPEHLSPALWELLSKDHIITNFPDEEDLTQQCKVLKFKDRLYNPGMSSGKGYKILRKNWMGQSNVLNKDNISHSNTIYEIRYDFDLQGQEIPLMKGCILLFKGGSLNNGTIVCNDTNIIGAHKFEDTGNAAYTGTFSKGLIMAKDNTIMWYDGVEWKNINSDFILEDSVTASVVEVKETSKASAEVNIVGNELQFKFGFPKGSSGSGGEGSGDGNLDDLTAEATAETSEAVSASVDVEGTNLKFKFGIPKGEKGDSGDVALATRTVMAFKTSIDAPDTPVGGSWDVANNIITYPEGWSAPDGLPSPVWMSVGEFHATAPNNPSWSIPIKISGEDGTDGTDGLNMEFIYKSAKNKAAKPTVPPSLNQTGYVPEEEGWTASPSGITEEMRVEWVCSRTKEDGTWGAWQGPTIWSIWGENGKDGDSVQYIYFVNNGEVVANPTPEDWATNSEYQEEKSEYVPTGLGWTDNPTGVSTTFTHEWVSVRKYRNGQWSEFSNPALWAKYGENGYNGVSTRTMYAVTENSSTVPEFVQDNINPGSVWSLAIPDYTPPQAVWAIHANVTYDNKLAEVEADNGEVTYGWYGPTLVTGTDGEVLMPANYKTYVYKMSDTQPPKPTFNDPNSLPNSGWYDYPYTTGQWWQCVGVVNGYTGLIGTDDNGELLWSEVLPVNGKDGSNGGIWNEFRFAVSDSNTKAPSLVTTDRYPDGWSINPPTKGESQYMWLTTAVINSDDTLNTAWSTPTCITGEKGPQGDTGPIGPAGPTGSQGVSGIPGVSFELRYCLGTLDTYDGTETPEGESPTGWLESVPSVTTDKPYIWCIQGRRVYQSIDDSTGVIAWGTPFKLSGTNGIDGKDGEQGKKGQIIYPAGIYSESVTYTTTAEKAPYVFYPSTNKFYVLNTIMSWTGTSQSSTPANSSHWKELTNFEAIYAKLGIIANGLIGSAVFNGDYMFSQQGVDKNGVSRTYNDIDGNGTAATISAINNGNWIPNILLNFKTGAGHFSAGNIVWDAAGNLSFLNSEIANGVKFTHKGAKYILGPREGLYTAGIRITKGTDEDETIAEIYGHDMGNQHSSSINLNYEDNTGYAESYDFIKGNIYIQPSLKYSHYIKNNAGNEYQMDLSPTGGIGFQTTTPSGGVTNYTGYTGTITAGTTHIHVYKGIIYDWGYADES